MLLSGILTCPRKVSLSLSLSSSTTQSSSSSSVAWYSKASLKTGSRLASFTAVSLLCPLHETRQKGSLELEPSPMREKSTAFSPRAWMTSTFSRLALALAGGSPLPPLEEEEAEPFSPFSPFPLLFLSGLAATFSASMDRDRWISPRASSPMESSLSSSNQSTAEE